MMNKEKSQKTFHKKQNQQMNAPQPKSNTGNAREKNVSASNNANKKLLSDSLSQEGKHPTPVANKMNRIENDISFLNVANAGHLDTFESAGRLIRMLNEKINRYESFFQTIIPTPNSLTVKKSKENGRVELSWKNVVSMEKLVEGYEVFLDNMLLDKIQGKGQAVQITDLEPGKHIFSIRALSKIGASKVVHATFDVVGEDATTATNSLAFQHQTFSSPDQIQNSQTASSSHQQQKAMDELGTTDDCTENISDQNQPPMFLLTDNENAEPDVFQRDRTITLSSSSLDSSDISTKTYTVEVETNDAPVTSKQQEILPTNQQIPPAEGQQQGKQTLLKRSASIFKKAKSVFSPAKIPSNRSAFDKSPISMGRIGKKESPKGPSTPTKVALFEQQINGLMVNAERVNNHLVKFNADIGQLTDRLNNLDILAKSLIPVPHEISGNWATDGSLIVNWENIVPFDTLVEGYDVFVNDELIETATERSAEISHLNAGTNKLSVQAVSKFGRSERIETLVKHPNRLSSIFEESGDGKENRCT